MQESEPSQDQAAIAITTQQSGFYEGFNRVVAVVPKLLIGALIVWVGLSPSVCLRYSVLYHCLFSAWALASHCTRKTG